MATDNGCNWMDHAFSERNFDKVCHIYWKGVLASAMRTLSGTKP